MRVAYLGPADTFTHMAALRHFGARANYVHLPSLDEIFAQVEQGACDYGVVPVENSIEGAITHTLDLFRQASSIICGEILLPIHHNLVAARSGRRAAQITKVLSHPQALAQCRGWLQRHLPQAASMETSSTAEAVERVAHDANPTHAAIATPAAAKRHGLRVIASSIEDHRHNMTRFLVIGRAPLHAVRGPQKTSLWFALKDRPGALHDALMPFKRQRINLTKIESRPSKRRAWEYHFFVDLLGHAETPRVAQALTALQRHCSEFRVLGSYPVAAAPRGTVS